MDKNTKYLVTCDEGALEYLRQGIARLGVAEARVSDVKGLGGEVAGFVVAGTVGVNAVTALLNLIASAIKLGKTIRSVKLDDRAITNPTEQEIENLKKENEP